jgi:pimeloyl-ACP methyl ester carboxylesterase
VHGLGSRWQVFEPILDRLAERHEVLAVDLPGFGATPPDPAVSPGVPGYATWLAGVLAELGVERPHLVGSSMGGAVALELGRAGIAGRVTAFAPIGFWRTPGRMWCQGLLTALRTGGRYTEPLLGPVLAHPAGRAALLAPLFGRPTRVRPADAAADAAAMVRAAAYPAACRSFATYRFDPPGRLDDIPVTVAWGTRDVVLWHRTQSARARVVLPAARHVDLPGCGHLPFNDDPARCARVVLDDPKEWT